MSVTTMENVINPQVMGDMINAKIEAQLKFTPYAKVDTSLVGVPGDTKTVPAWGYIGDASAIGENQQIDYTQMSATSQSFKVGKAGKGVSLTTESIESGLGNPVGQAETQLAKSIVSRVNLDVLAAALTGTMKYNGLSGVIGYNGIVEANGMFEDEEDGIEKVMFIHPRQETQLLKDENFLSTDKFAAGTAVNGAIGKIAGCWIKKSKKVPMVDAITAVQGVHTVKIGGSVASGDKITIAGVETTLDGTSGASASAAVTAIKAKSFDDYTVTGSGATLTFTEKSGKEGTGAPACASTASGTTFDVATTTEGVAAEVAKYVNPIIKMEPDNAETEYTEDELPAITIFLKKDTTVTSEYNKDYDRHEIVAYRYYGVAKTNDAKIVVAKFAQQAAG